MRLLKIAVIVLGVFLIGGCRPYADEATLKANIGELLTKYQNGVNNMNRALLESVISDKFSFYNVDRNRYIDELLTMTQLIDSMSYTNIRVENYKIFANVTTLGSSIFRPDVQLPLFKTLPFMNGRQKKQSVFAFLYEEKEGLKILAEDQVLTEKEILWGTHPPSIIQPRLSAYRVSPGDQIEVTFQVNKSNNDVLFVFVNEQMIGGYSLGGYSGDSVHYMVKVPAALRRGDDFEIKLQTFAGKIDLNNPGEAVLQGAMVRSFVIPVR